MKKVTITDVALKAKVSKSTISHYLNERFSNMSVETKERISSAIEELNYSPNYVAKSLKNKKTMTIGVIVANILHNFSTQIIRAVEDFANEEKYHVIVCNADNDPVKEKDYINMLLAKQVDGLIVVPMPENRELFSKLVKDEYPIVFIDRYIDDAAVSSYLLDNTKSVKMAYDYLLDKGHAEIGFVSQSVDSITPRIERQNEYLRLCNLHGRKPFSISEDLNLIQTSIEKHIHRKTLPSALIVANDLALFEVLRAVKNSDITIPENVSIISIDDIEFAEFFNPGLTVIAQPAFDIAKEAARSLFGIINNGNNEFKTERFQPNLIERNSVSENENRTYS